MRIRRQLPAKQPRDFVVPTGLPMMDMLAVVAVVGPAGWARGVFTARTVTGIARLLRPEATAASERCTPYRVPRLTTAAAAAVDQIPMRPIRSPEVRAGSVVAATARDVIADPALRQQQIPVAEVAVATTKDWADLAVPES